MDHTLPLWADMHTYVHSSEDDGQDQSFHKTLPISLSTITK